MESAFRIPNHLLKTSPHQFTAKPKIQLHNNMSLRDAAKFAEEVGCTVRAKRRKGEFAFSHPLMEKSKVVNCRKKDAGKALVGWLKGVETAIDNMTDRVIGEHKDKGTITRGDLDRITEETKGDTMKRYNFDSCKGKTLSIFIRNPGKSLMIGDMDKLNEEYQLGLTHKQLGDNVCHLKRDGVVLGKSTLVGPMSYSINPKFEYALFDGDKELTQAYYESIKRIAEAAEKTKPAEEPPAKTPEVITSPPAEETQAPAPQVQVVDKMVPVYGPNVMGKPSAMVADLIDTTKLLTEQLEALQNVISQEVEPQAEVNAALVLLQEALKKRG